LRRRRGGVFWMPSVVLTLAKGTFMTNGAFIRSALAAIVVLALAGCNTPTTWAKPGASHQDFLADSYGCEMDARRVAYL
jgi:hypothetical protein